VLKSELERTTFIWDSMLYNNKPGRGQPEISMEEQKARLQQHHEKPGMNKTARQLQMSILNRIVPGISVSTFENVMYAAGYSR
jgi:hypothetical protein